MTPKPRDEVFDTYWKFAAERQRVYYRKLHGFPHPWTDDEIIGSYRFCNAFRAADRVSQHLIRHVIYGEHLSQDPREVVFRCLLYRFFNLPSTWELLEKLYEAPSLDNFDVDRWYRDMDTGQQLFNGAYMLCGIKTHGYDKKHGNYLGLVKDMVDGGMIEVVLGASSMEEVVRELQKYKLVAKFLSYQIAIDLNYSEATNFSENSFTVAGPGAVRGIKKCFEDTGGMTPEQVIHWMQERQEEEFTKRGIPLDIAWLWGRPLQAIDIQNLFCETDKYCRVAFPEVEAQGRQKIKSTYKVDPKPSPTPFFPPKWGINDKVSVLPDVEPVKNPDDDLPWSMEW